MAWTKVGLETDSFRQTRWNVAGAISASVKDIEGWMDVVLFGLFAEGNTTHTYTKSYWSS